MSWSRITMVSLAVNVALLGIAAWALWQRPNRPPPVAVTPLTVTNTITRIAVQKISPSNFWATLAANRAPSWSIVESTNYVTYIDNLRTIGCPEETIKDIIIADVVKLYAKKRAALLAQAKPDPYWMNARKTSPEKLALRQQLEALQQEEQTLVKQLLGAELDVELGKYTHAEENDRAAADYSYLPEEKRQKLFDLQRQFEEAEQLVYQSSKGLFLEEDQEKIRKLERQKEEEMAKILTPEELEEHQLRTSATASNLRNLQGFEPNEEEFRQLFRLQKTYDDQFNNAFDLSDEKQLEIRVKAQAEAQEALNQEVKKVLGEKRFTEYQRAQDPDYQNLVQLSERFEVAPDVTMKVYEMKQAAERQKAAVEGNANLTAERRQAALDALAQETQRSIAEALGGNQSKAWTAYKRNGGQWMNGLKSSEVPEIEMPVPVDNTPTTPLPFPPFPPVLPVR